MNVNSANGMPYSSPPPSYTEAMAGTPSYTEAVSGTLAPVHEIQLPAPAPTAQVYSNDPLGQPAIVSTQPQLLPASPMFRCPPGAEPLLAIREVLVYPCIGKVFKVKTSLKQVILTVKARLEAECCDCCCSTTALEKSFTLRTITKQEVALMRRFVDSINILTAPVRHMDISVTPGVPTGRILTDGSRKYMISDTSGSILFTVTQESAFFSTPPYQVFTASGDEIGKITYGRGGKHWVQFPPGLQVHHKILLLFLAVSLQDDADRRRRNNSYNNS